MYERKRIPGLDLARFLAALGILAYHFCFIGVIEGFYAWDVFMPIAFWGELGVDIFFIISGFVILFSIENKRTASQFLSGRIIRVYPAFIICSVLTMMMGMLMPATEKKDLLYRWMASLSLCNENFLGGGYSLLSSVYWTLMVEIKFYILVAIIKKAGIWVRWRYQILFLWVSLSLINTLGFQWRWLDVWLNCKYSGHFTAGIIMYLFYCKGEKNKWMLPLISESVWLIFRNCKGYLEWIKEIYSPISYSETDILFAIIILLLLLNLTIHITIQNQKLNVRLSCLGAWSYTIYLIHADFGYFIRTQYYNRLIVWMPWLSKIVNEYVIMLAATVFSLLLSYIILLITQKIESVLKMRLLKIKF